MEEKNSIGSAVYWALGALFLVLVFGIVYLLLAGIPEKPKDEGRIAPSAPSVIGPTSPPPGPSGAPAAPVKPLTVAEMLDQEMDKCLDIEDRTPRFSCLSGYLNAAFDRSLDSKICQRFATSSPEQKACDGLYYSRRLAKAGTDKDVAVCDEFADAAKTACQADFWTARAMEQGEAACEGAGDAGLTALCADKYNALRRLGGTDYDCGIYRGQAYRDDCLKLQQLADGGMTALNCGLFATPEFKRLCD